MDDNEIRNKVRDNYGRIAKNALNGCGCGPSTLDISKVVGYSGVDLSEIPEDAILGLGCGNPIATANIKEGEIILDLGSGAGIDCFLAAKKVGENGKVIGVDMTHEMITRARESLKKEKIENVEFRLGEIENLPVADNSIDLIISNCVINLSIDKNRVFQEAFRVLKPGGRINVSDIVLIKELPENIKNNPNYYISCISGAIKEDKYTELITQAGFKDIKTIKNFRSGNYIKSITVSAYKP